MAIEKSEDQAIVTPAEAERVLEMMKAFDYFKANVLSDRDVVDIQGKPFVKKSGWSKYALACNVSTELRDERVEERDAHRIYHFTYRAVHLPSGRFAEAVGSASEAERDNWNHPEHDVRTLAQTRAFNRAISNLVGGGEISAEEMAPKSRPSSRPRKRVESEVAEPPGLKPGKVSLNIIEYNLKAVNPSLVDMVTIVEDAEGFDITPSKDIDNEDWNTINGVLKTFGAVWKQNGLVSLWVIRKEGSGV